MITLTVCLLLSSLLMVDSARLRLLPLPSLCYECHGSLDLSRRIFCSLEMLAASEIGCKFAVWDTGVWKAGALKKTDLRIERGLSCTYSGGITKCTCSGNFCNRFETVADHLKKTFWPSSEISSSPPTLMLPSSLPTECFECGRLYVEGYGLLNVPCEMSHLCHGDYCMTKRGSHPHSYCGSLWTGDVVAQCTHLPGQPEICTCTESLCNALYTPLNETTPTSTTPTTTATTKKTEGGKPCPQGRFTANPQTVWMGEKLKEIIDRNFGSDKVAPFDAGINRHICDYSDTTPATADG